MSAFIAQASIFGHSFVRRLHDDLNRGFDSRAKQNFNLAGSGVCVSLQGTGGRIVEKVKKYYISVISSFKPDIIILEIGTNDLCSLPPEVHGWLADRGACTLFSRRATSSGCCGVSGYRRNLLHSATPDSSFKNAPTFSVISVISFM